jgi:hypothetical protein
LLNRIEQRLTGIEEKQKGIAAVLNQKLNPAERPAQKAVTPNGKAP